MSHATLPEHLTIRSSDKQAIIDALDQDIVRRMRNWVDWLGGGSTSCASSWLTEYGVRLDRYAEARMPLFVAEAERTDAAIRTIPDELGQAVSLFWLGGEEASFREMGSALGCHHETCRDRILRGHKLLTAEVYKRNAAAEPQPHAAGAVGLTTTIPPV